MPVDLGDWLSPLENYCDLIRASRLSTMTVANDGGLDSSCPSFVTRGLRARSAPLLPS